MAMPPEAPQDNAQEDAKDGGADDAQEQQGGAKELIMGVSSGLAKVVGMVQQAGAPDDVVKQLQGSLDAFRSAISQLMGGGGGGPQQMGAGSATPEAGGNKNAMPMG